MSTTKLSKSGPKPPDLSIFEESSKPANNKRCSYTNCPSLKRLVATLAYYSHLDVANNTEHQNIFIHFVSNVHTNLLDDYIHFVTIHANEIEKMHHDFMKDETFPKCDMKNCQMTTRHHEIYNHRMQQQKVSHGADFTLKFYKETMDSLHFYIFHIFDAGLRKLSTAVPDKMENEEKKEDEYFDLAFARTKRELARTNKDTEAFRRFDSGNNNAKFSIKTEYDVADEYIADDNIDGTGSIDTYMDSLYTHLETKGANTDSIYSLFVYIQQEQYDTESMSIDVSEFGVDGNISQSVKNQIINILIRNLQSVESMSSFTFGKIYCIQL